MNWQPYTLHEMFEDGEPLIPEGWNPLLWADDDMHYPLMNPGSVPKEGSIVALLIDKRIIPSDALMVETLNRIEFPKPKTNDIVEVFFYLTMSKKSRVRKVILARYSGLDRSGLPIFTNVGSGSEDPADSYKGINFNDTHAVAWKYIEIPYLPDVEL